MSKSNRNSEQRAHPDGPDSPSASRHTGAIPGCRSWTSVRER